MLGCEIDLCIESSQLNAFFLCLSLLLCYLCLSKTYHLELRWKIRACLIEVGEDWLIVHLITLHLPENRGHI